MMLPRGDDDDPAGDRIVVIGSPKAATGLGRLLAPGRRRSGTSSIFGAGRVGLRDRPCAARAGHRRADDRGRTASGRGASPRSSRRHACTTRRARPRLPRARAHRPGAGRDLRDARGREEPVRRHARTRTRRPLHDRDRPRSRSRGRSTSTRGSTSRSTRGGDGRGDRPLRARPAYPAGRDDRGQPLRGARHHDAAVERVRRAQRSATCRSTARSSARSSATAKRCSRTATTSCRRATA